MGSEYPFCNTLLEFSASLLCNVDSLDQFAGLSYLVGVPVNHVFCQSMIQSLNYSGQHQ